MEREGGREGVERGRKGIEREGGIERWNGRLRHMITTIKNEKYGSCWISTSLN
jgi:hypothetical protein